jgi:hypothetical protein
MLVLNMLLTDDVPDPMKVNAFEYPEDAKEVLTRLLMDDVPVPMMEVALRVATLAYPEE